jgi:hypothetical protein
MKGACGKGTDIWESTDPEHARFAFLLDASTIHVHVEELLSSDTSGIRGLRCSRRFS